MAVLRQVVGDTLRGVRLRQQRTLREVSSTARVSLGYLSEVERGQKEPSSELLAAICGALEVEMSEVFAEVTDTLRREEKLAGASRIPVSAAHATLGSASAAPLTGSAISARRQLASTGPGPTLPTPAATLEGAPVLRSLRSEPTVAA